MQAEPEPVLGPAPSSESPQIDPYSYNRIIEQAMLNSGIAVAPQTRASTWYPSATIRFEDDMDRDDDGTPDNVIIPLEGVKVRCVNFVNVGSGYTNAAGYVGKIKGWAGKFMGSVDYSIHWENNIWDIRDGRLDQARTRGPERRYQWDFVIRNSERKKASYFAAIHRALHTYYYKDYPLTNGLTRCHNLGQIKVGTEWSENNTGRFNPIPGWFWGNEIVLWARKDNKDKSRWKVMSTTFHELGHASHYAIDGVDMVFAGDRIRETWANGVEYAFMESLYPGAGDNVMNDYDSTYTAAVESLLNQGLTLGQVQNALRGADRWDEWRANIKNSTSVPDEVVDMIFANSGRPINNMRDFISGNETPIIGFGNTYNARIFRGENDLPTGVTFNGWTVSGSGVSSSDYVFTGATNHQAQITFLKLKQYRLTAEFLFTGGNVYRASYIVEATVPDLSIGGTNMPILNSSTPYGSYPKTLPEGITFGGWEISPGENNVEWSMSASSNLLNPSIWLTFRTPGVYTLTANFNFPRGLRHSVSKEVSTLHISGPDEPQRMVPVSYSIPVAQAQAAGITFNGWEVTPGHATGACIINGGTNGASLNITFRASAPFTINANFTRADGTRFTVTKVIDFLSFPQCPTIEQDMTYHGTPKVLIKNTQGGATYSWSVVGGHIVEYGSNYVLVRKYDGPGAGDGIGAKLKCRTTLNGKTSDWSNEITIVAVRPYSMVLSSDDLTLDDVEATELGETASDIQSL